MQKDTLKPTSKRIRAKQVGRGGKRGKTSGRGHKGQKARAGRKIRPEVRDFIKTIPKLRGHSSDSVTFRKKYYVVNVSDLERFFSDGDEVSPKTLLEKRLIKSRATHVSNRGVKVLGNGSITKKVNVFGCSVSESARYKIKRAGGKTEGE